MSQTAVVLETQRTADAGLVKHAQAGDRQAFARLYDRYFASVYDFVARVLRSPEDAEAVVEDIFARSMHGLGGLQGAGHFRAWLFAIARGRAARRADERLRTAADVGAASGDQLAAFTAVEAGRLQDGASAAGATEVAAQLWHSMASLSAEQYSLLDMHLRQGLSTAEIADTLGVTRHNGSIMLERLEQASRASIGASLLLQLCKGGCRQLDALLQPTEASAITPHTQQLFERHVEQCAVCRQRLADIPPPLEVFAGLANVAPRPGFEDSLRGRLLRDWPGVPGSDATIPRAGSGDMRVAPFAAPGAGNRRPLASTLIGVGGLVAGLLLIGAALFASPFSGSAADRPAVTLAFTTANGEPVPGVRVEVTLDSEQSDQQTVQADTDDAGQIELGALLIKPQAGTYAVQVVGLPPGLDDAEIAGLEPFSARDGDEIVVTGVFTSN